MTAPGKGRVRGLPARKPDNIYLARVRGALDWKRLGFILLGAGLFCLVYFSPAWPDAVDPQGKAFALTAGGKAALALFLLVAVWWVSEVIPIGATSIAVAVLQALFLIRGEANTRAAFTDFFSPSVWFIFGSIVIGLVFTKTGLTNRLAYKMLTLVGEKTSMIYLGAFTLTSGLTLIMAHTAVAATVYPLLMAIYALYEPGEKPTRFGKGLFIGMAFTAGAGSIITLLGAARGAVAIDFYKEQIGRDVRFFELTYYMLPVGVVMTLLLTVFFVVLFRPEKRTIPGLRERARMLYARLGPVSRQEIVTLVLVLSAITFLGARSFSAELQKIDKSAVILATTVLFFLLKILSIKDLESIPWNIILLFGGAMSLGICLYETGAAQWLAVFWLSFFENAQWFVFLMGLTFFVMIMTNLIMNVAAIAICLPVALAMAPYLNVDPEAVLYCSLAAAGMPFLLLVGAAPNAIAYNSRLFTTGEFFKTGIWASLVLMVVLAVFVLLIWPAMGMRIVLP